MLDPTGQVIKRGHVFGHYRRTRRGRVLRYHDVHRVSVKTRILMEFSDHVWEMASAPFFCGHQKQFSIRDHIKTHMVKIFDHAGIVGKDFFDLPDTCRDSPFCHCRRR